MTGTRITWRSSALVAFAIASAACAPKSHPASSRPAEPSNRPSAQADPERVIEALERSLPALPIVRASSARPTRSDPSPLPADPEIDTALARGDRVLHEHGTILVGMSSDEAPAIVPYLDELLDRATSELSTRYSVAAPRLRVEMYSSRAALRARLGGRLPYDVDGAYASGVVVMLSPAGGAGNWGETLVHELAHAYQEARLGTAVPRWLAEGLAEADAHALRSEWVREPSADLARVLPRDGESVLDALGRSIDSPTTDQEQGNAYWLAMELVSDVRTRVPAECSIAWMEGPRTSSGAGCPSLDALAESFWDARGPALRDRAARHVPAVFSAAREPTGESADAFAARAADALVARRFEDATRAADAALASDARHRLALYVRARTALAARDASALAFVERLAAEGPALEARLALARVAFESGDTDVAATQLDAALALEEPSVASWDLALRLSDRMPRFDRDLCRMRIVDLDERAADLALEVVRAASRAGRWDVVIRYGERAIYSVPGRVELHELLATAYDRTGDRVRATRERSVIAALPH